MQVFQWLLMGLAGWTAIGVLGSGLAWVTGLRQSAVRGMRWIAGVWAVYLAVLLGVGHFAGQKVLTPGEEECFGKACYSVVGASAVPEFMGEGAGRLVQVEVRIRNTDPERTPPVNGLEAYLVDGAGRRWGATPGLGGVRLGQSLPPGANEISSMVFRVEPDAEQLGMVFTRGRHGWGWLVIGNTDVPGHRKTVLRLPQVSAGATPAPEAGR